jgi:hypothetical protein
MKKSMMLVAAAAIMATVGLSSAAAPADAAGCVKGAVVGGVAGHVLGGHGLLGAGVGCAIGHHEANRHQRDRGHDNRAYGREPGYGSSDQHRW